MATVTSDIDIEMPITTVYNQWTQFEDFPAFMSGVESIQQKTDDELHWNVSVGGAKREFDARITELNRKWPFAPKEKEVKLP